MASALPQTMRAVYTTQHGPPSVLELSTSHPVPSPAARSDELLVRVRAVSLAPGDYRTLRGDAPRFKGIPHGWPYVPAGDVAGVVVARDEAGARARAFNVGDEVVASWHGRGCDGGLAEYALVDAKVAVRRPGGVSPVDAAAVVNSGAHALDLVKEGEVKEGDRVLVIGGGGGCGTLVCQLLRNAGASYVAVTSRSGEEVLKGLGVDEVVDWREDKWWEREEWGDAFFDVVIDCAIGRAAWENVGIRALMKPGKAGRWVAVIAERWDMELAGVRDVVALMAPPMLRVLKSKIFGGTKYVMHLKQPEPEDIEELIQLMLNGKLRAVLESVGELSIADVQAGFEKLISKTAHGKIVFSVWDGEE